MRTTILPAALHVTPLHEEHGSEVEVHEVSFAAFAGYHLLDSARIDARSGDAVVTAFEPGQVARRVKRRTRSDAEADAAAAAKEEERLRPLGRYIREKSIHRAGRPSNEPQWRRQRTVQEGRAVRRNRSVVQSGCCALRARGPDCQPDGQKGKRRVCQSPFTRYNVALANKIRAPPEEILLALLPPGLATATPRSSKAPF